MKEIVLGENDAGQRLDRFLSKYLSYLPPSLISKLIRKKKFRINGAVAKHFQILCSGDKLSMYISDDLLSAPPQADVFWHVKAEMPEIIFEDNNILIADKPSGLLVHSDTRDNPDTLITRIQRYLYEKGSWDPCAENAFVPALCHRLDRNTSGLVVAAKNAAALREMNEIIKNRELGRSYICAVKSEPVPREGVLTGYILKNSSTNTVSVHARPVPGAKTAITKYSVLENRSDMSLVRCELVTGRTHQIRAQMAGAGWPIVGDSKYGRDNTRQGQALCAYMLDFSHIRSGTLLSYLKGKTFTVRSIPFAQNFQL